MNIPRKLPRALLCCAFFIPLLAWSAAALAQEPTAHEVAAAVDRKMLLTDGAQYNYFTRESARGHTVFVEMEEIAEDVFRFSVIVQCPPAYWVNDDILKFGLLINGETEQIAPYVTQIQTTDDGTFDVFYTAVTFHQPITSLAITPYWCKVGFLEEDRMVFTVE